MGSLDRSFGASTQLESGLATATVTSPAVANTTIALIVTSQSVNWDNNGNFST